MSDETTLLPCPFCGGEAHIEKYCDMCSTEIDFKCARDKSPDAICAIGEEVFWVEHKCELLSNDEELYVGCFTSAREAIEAWNTRAELGSGTCEWLYPQGVAGWVGYAECSNCGYRVYEDTIDEREWTYCPNCGREVVSAND